MTRSSCFRSHMVAPHNAPDTVMKVTTWSWAQKKLIMGLALHYVTNTLFWLVAKHFQFQLTC